MKAKQFILRSNRSQTRAQQRKYRHNKTGKIIFRITQQKPTDKKKQTIIN